MHKVALALSLLAFAGHGQRAQTSIERPQSSAASESSESLTTLASLLLALSPTDAFNPSMPAGVGFPSSTRRAASPLASLAKQSRTIRRKYVPPDMSNVTLGDEHRTLLACTNRMCKVHGQAISFEMLKTLASCHRNNPIEIQRVWGKKSKQLFAYNIQEIMSKQFVETSNGGCLSHCPWGPNVAHKYTAEVFTYISTPLAAKLALDDIKLDIPMAAYEAYYKKLVALEYETQEDWPNAIAAYTEALSLAAPLRHDGAFFISQLFEARADCHGENKNLDAAREDIARAQKMAKLRYPKERFKLTEEQAAKMEAQRLAAIEETELDDAAIEAKRRNQVLNSQLTVERPVDLPTAAYAQEY